MGRVSDMIIQICELLQEGYTDYEVATKLDIPLHWVRDGHEYLAEFAEDEAS